jgi:hypothetical protein
MDMSIHFVDDVLRKLRLLARVNAVCDSTGRLVRGGIDQRVEALREQVSVIHDHLLDGLEPTEDQVALVVQCHAVVRMNHRVVAQLQREYCA